MGCPAFSFACEETQAKHPKTEQGVCKQAQVSVTLSMGTHAVPLAPEPWPPGSQGAAGDSAEVQGDRCPALVLKLPLEVTGATGVHNYWPKTGTCPEDSWVKVSLRV